MKESLERAHFHSVNLSIDNHSYGFEILAIIPDPTDQLHTHLHFQLGIEEYRLPTLTVRCDFRLTRLFSDTESETTFLWEAAPSFTDGGSQEAVVLASLRADIAAALSNAAKAAAAAAIAAPERKGVAAQASS